MPRRNRNRQLAYTPGRLLRLEDELHRIQEARETRRRYRELERQLGKGRAR